MTAQPTIHANCVVLGEAGVLLRGASGSGKSSLSAALIDDAAAHGRFARLVADDRVRLRTRNGRLLASAPVETAGLIERRGLGVQRAPFVASAVIRLVVDLEPAVARMPDETDLFCAIEGVLLPRLAIATGAHEGPALVVVALRTLSQARDCVSSALAFGQQDGKITTTMETPSNSRSGGARAASGGLRSERNEFCAETQ